MQMEKIKNKKLKSHGGAPTKLEIILCTTLIFPASSTTGRGLSGHGYCFEKTSKLSQPLKRMLIIFFRLCQSNIFTKFSVIAWL